MFTMIRNTYLLPETCSSSAWAAVEMPCLVQTMEKIAEWERDGSVFVVRPSKPLEIGRLEKDYATLEAGYRLGYETARELLPRLREYVG